MKRIAFVFSTAPHGTAAGREGLDALLATSALTDDLAVFFIADGVFQLLPTQKPDAVLARDYIATFKLLGLYDIEQCWVCAASLRERGLDPQTHPLLSKPRRSKQMPYAANSPTTMLF